MRLKTESDNKYLIFSEMNKLIIPLILFVLASVSCKRTDVSAFVDPNIGGVAPLLTTKNPTVHRPHSMVRVFPVTKPGLGDRYLSDKIYGFALNMPAYRNGHVTELMPTTGKISASLNENASGYDHDFEEVHPWYHKVLLEDQDIVADWTTTERAVIYRFNFLKGDSCNIIFRSHGNSSFRMTANNVLQGWEESKSTRQYFYAEFSRQFTSSGIIDNNSLMSDKIEISGRGIGSYVTFINNGSPVEIKIGISFIDENQAKDNMSRETNGKTFEKVSAESHKIWENTLGKIIVSGGTDRQKRIFYTSLYRASERMVNISEYGRYFSGYDKRVHDDNGRPFLCRRLVVGYFPESSSFTVHPRS